MYVHQLYERSVWYEILLTIMYHAVKLKQRERETYMA
jgi:hypothetical protein